MHMYIHVVEDKVFNTEQNAFISEMAILLLVSFVEVEDVCSENCEATEQHHAVSGMHA